MKLDDVERRAVGRGEHGVRAAQGLIYTNSRAHWK
jgi:hypothetical protein